MVKFDDENETEYKKLENLILKMVKPVNPPQVPRTSTAPAMSSTTSPPSFPPGGISNNPPESTTSFTPSPPLGGPGINLFFHLENQQGYSAFPSRQYTEPLPHRSPPSASAQTNSSRNPRAAPNAHQPSASDQSQTEFQPHVPDDDNPFNRLAMFDTAFIVDDTGSMIVEARADEPTKDRWEVTNQALNHIARIAAEQDTDGIELRFLKSDLRGDNLRTADDVKKILAQINLLDGTHGGGTSFRGRLKEMIDPRVLEYQWYKEDLSDYQSKLRQARSSRVRPTEHPRQPIPPKPYNLIVITDGAADDKPEVEEYIVNTATELDRLKAPKRQVGIQFVQVGEDGEAKEFLRRLDDDLSNRVPPIRDVSLSRLTTLLPTADMQ